LAQFQILVNAKIEQALRKTMEILLVKLKEIIMEEVYSYNSSNENWNNRTYEFLNSWNTSEPVFIGNVLSSVLSQDGFEFSWNDQRDMWSHGNGLYPLFTEFLDDIINDGLGESNFNFPAIEPRPYWTRFEAYCDLNVLSIFATQCALVGLPLSTLVDASYSSS